MPTYDDKQYGTADPQGRADREDSAMDEIEDQLDTIAQQATSFIADETRHNPYRTVLVAAGIGYVLGGGIPSWAMRLGFGTATRMAMAAAIAKLTSSSDD